MKGRAIPYSAEELAWIQANKALSRRDLHAAFVARFERADVKLDDIKSLCTRRRWNTGRTGRFEKGIVPHNKGKPFRAGGRSAETQFKPGCRHGSARENYKPIGTERFSKEGFLERKIHDGLPLQSRWRAVHLIRWEAANGPIPKGHCLKCLDGDRLNTDPSNWKLISRATLGILNRASNGIRYDDAPPELKPTILAIAEVKAAAAKSQRSARR